MINYSESNKYELCEQLGAILLTNNSTVATVESCTGGGLAYAITEIAGSSQWFKQSWVTYTNAAKNKLVNVPMSLLEEHGAVSEAVVSSMASNGAQLSESNYCVAISGIAGPAGGTHEKPVGLVWFAIASRHSDQPITFSRRFTGSRHEVREQAIVLSLQKLISCLAD